MAHPYFHALSSARQYGGLWSDYFAIHESVDATKSHYAHCKHRLVLHNHFGIQILRALHGDTLIRASDQQTVSIEILLEQHIYEDLGTIPTLAECFEKAPMPSWGKRIKNLTDQCRHSAARFGGHPDDYQNLHQTFDQAIYHWDDPRNNLILHNSWGIYFIAALLGPTYQRPSDLHTLPTRYLLEYHVTYECGSIPSLKDNLVDVIPRAWTCSRARSLRETTDLYAPDTKP